MQKFTFKIDLTKINKDRIITRQFQNQAGETVTVKEYEFEAVPKTSSMIKEGDSWQLWKTGFISGKSIKQENGSYSKEPIFGDVLEFRSKDNGSAMAEVKPQGYNGEIVDYSDIPF